MGLTHRVKDRESGAVLVEAAFVLPLLMLLVLGIVEWGLAFKNSLSVSSASRSGARTASAEPHKTSYTTDASSAVAIALKALPSDAPQQLWLYKAGTDGTPVMSDGTTSSGTFADCAQNWCDKFTWNQAGQSWTPVSGYDWPAAKQQACAGSADSVGVYVVVQHRFITGLFGSTRTLSDHTVMRLEPIPSAQVCGAS